jgi:hypothetical protein
VWQALCFPDSAFCTLEMHVTLSNISGEACWAWPLCRHFLWHGIGQSPAVATLTFTGV